MTVEQTYFPSGGSTSTPAHHYSDFKFKTYAPIAFRYFRDLFGIQPDDFLVSLSSSSVFTCLAYSIFYNRMYCISFRCQCVANR